MGDTVEAQTVTIPGRVARVAMDNAVRDLTRAALPTDAPGLIAAGIDDTIRADLPRDLPAGGTPGCWQKVAHPDPEAKGRVRRAETGPLGFRRPS